MRQNGRYSTEFQRTKKSTSLQWLLRMAPIMPINVLLN